MSGKWYHIIRGGAWDSARTELSSGIEQITLTTERRNNVGLRLMRKCGKP